MQHRFAVVGSGLVGTALTRRLAEAGHGVICIGPGIGRSPFSSHDDSGRITRILDRSKVWAALAARSIAGYPDIERRSRVRFHHPVGVLWSSAAETPLETLVDVGASFEVERATGVGGWDGVFGFAGEPSVLERGSAGHIAPREMLRAHRTLALAAGAAFDARVATAIEAVGDRRSVSFGDGDPVVVDRVVVAAGAGSRELVDIDASVTGEVVIDAAVQDDVGERLSDSPCIGRLSSDGSIVEGYLTPPIRGGDGWAIKFGAESDASPVLVDGAAVEAWMTGTGHRGRLEPMEQALSDLLPSLVFGRIRSRPCLYTRTPSGLPIVDEIDRGLIVATGGNGRMAKSADAVAALAAPLVTDGSWSDDLPHHLFAAR